MRRLNATQRELLSLVETYEDNHDETDKTLNKLRRLAESLPTRKMRAPFPEILDRFHEGRNERETKQKEKGQAQTSNWSPERRNSE